MHRRGTLQQRPHRQVAPAVQRNTSEGAQRPLSFPNRSQISKLAGLKRVSLSSLHHPFFVSIKLNAIINIEQPIDTAFFDIFLNNLQD